MSNLIATFAALSRALAPPSGDPDAFVSLGLERPERAALAREHAALFGRSGPARVSPYVCAAHGDALHAVRTEYAHAGLEPAPDFRDRADHICVQFAFLEALVDEEQRAEHEGRTEHAAHLAALRHAFLAGRFGRFVPRLLDGLDGEVAFPIHRRLAGRARSLLAAAGIDTAALSDAPAEDTGPRPICDECGARFGSPIRARPPRPAWAAVCAHCRMRTDLRRTSR